jgi:hypothetical protein
LCPTGCDSGRLAQLENLERKASNQKTKETSTSCPYHRYLGRLWVLGIAAVVAGIARIKLTPELPELYLA